MSLKLIPLQQTTVMDLNATYYFGDILQGLSFCIITQCLYVDKYLFLRPLSYVAVCRVTRQVVFTHPNTDNYMLSVATGLKGKYKYTRVTVNSFKYLYITMDLVIIRIWV